LKKRMLNLLVLVQFGLGTFCGQPVLAGDEAVIRHLPDVSSPAERVRGEPGQLQIVDRSCRQYPVTRVRQRIVDIALQEWRWFGGSILDMTGPDIEPPRKPGERPWWWSDWRTPEEARRVADDIAGYWAAAPASSWIVNKQNQRWNELGITARWRDFWSAAFISWVMCESGLGRPEQFQRAIAHHTYIDQAIRARDGQDTGAAYVAYDVGEAEILPGDLLCRGSRPAYMNLSQRRSQMGQGARTHCDVVVELDVGNEQIRVVGGNVRGSVRMKRLPAKTGVNGLLQPVPYGGRRIFSHLKLMDHGETMALSDCVEYECAATES